VPVLLRAFILIVTVLDVPVLKAFVRVFTRTPSVDSVQSEGGSLELVRPHGAGPWPAWVFVNGAHPERRREPVVQRLTEGLARAGYLVVVPDPPGLADETITGDTLDGACAAVRAATHLPDVQGGRIALLGVSTGAGLALLVAAEPDLQKRISVVAAAVPYADLERILCLATTSSYADNGDVARFPESELLTRVAKRSLIAVAGSEADEAVAELLANRDFEAFPSLYERLPERVRACITRLSPLSVAGQVQAPVELVVPPRDEYFPHGEALALAKALPDARLTVTGTLDHTRPSARLRGLIRFLGFVARGLRRARN
jgi:pimeloyl-ACP methyl ester carboxylesterase